MASPSISSSQHISPFRTSMHRINACSTVKYCVFVRVVMCSFISSYFPSDSLAFHSCDLCIGPIGPQDLLVKLLAGDPNERPDATSVLVHPWLKGPQSGSWRAMPVAVPRWPVLELVHCTRAHIRTQYLTSWTWNSALRAARCSKRDALHALHSKFRRIGTISAWGPGIRKSNISNILYDTLCQSSH